MREWMKMTVAHAVCRLGMQLRGVTPSYVNGCGAETGGSVCGHRLAIAHSSPPVPKAPVP